MERSSAQKVVAMAVVLLIVASDFGEAQTAICNMTFAGLNACKPSVTPPNPPPPSRECCTALSHADLHCFCTYRNSNTLPSLGIDPDLAMKLPDKCKLTNSPNC